jgi:hypothetical protein
MSALPLAYATLLTGAIEAACYLYADNLFVLLSRVPWLSARPALVALLRACRWALQLLFCVLLGWQGASLLLRPSVAARASPRAAVARAAAAAAAAPASPPGVAGALAARVRAERAALKSPPLCLRDPHITMAPLVHVFAHPFEAVVGALERAAPPGARVAVGAAAAATARGVAARTRTDRVTVPIPPAAAKLGLPPSVELVDEHLQLPEARFLRVVRRNAGLREMGEMVVRGAKAPKQKNLPPLPTDAPPLASAPARRPLCTRRTRATPPLRASPPRLPSLLKTGRRAWPRRRSSARWTAKRFTRTTLRHSPRAWRREPPKKSLVLS